jgi:uncharacterized protein (DUF697 family)/GTP-binding protein EngB required for normal cell division
MDNNADFRQKYEEAKAKNAKPTILVCGYTGSGKTSLIQCICGRDTVPDNQIGHGKPMTQNFMQYRNEFINLWDSRGLEPGDQEIAFLKNTESLILRLQADHEPLNHIHLVWYTIQGPGARVTATDIQLIKNVFSNVIVVITKSDITKPQQQEAITSELVANGIKPSAIISVSEDDPDALQNLVAESSRLLPEAYKEAFCSAQLIDLSSKKIKAQAVIHSAAVSASAAGGLNPIPISDAVFITPIQFGMIAGLAVIYGMPSEAVKAAAAPLVTQVVGVMTASSLVKIWPGFGGFIQAGVALSLTEAIGQWVALWMVRCCEARIKGHPIPDFDMPLAGIAQLLPTKKLQ